MVADLIRGFVDGDWTRALDLETLERVREIGVSHDLREREDDILWRVRLTFGWGEPLALCLSTAGVSVFCW